MKYKNTSNEIEEIAFIMIDRIKLMSGKPILKNGKLSKHYK